MANTEKLGFNYRGRAWADGETIPRVTLPDGTLAEAMGALGYGWNGSAFQKLLVDGSGNLLVAVTGAGSGGTSSADGAAYTAGTTAGTAVMAVRDDTATSTLAEDKVGIVRQTTNRALHVNLRDASGNELSVGGGTQYADGAAVGTATGTQLMLWDGANERAAKGDQTNGLWVNVKTSALPSGAATAAKQPALGTAGSASADVITVQGVASMTALKVDGSAVAQPVTDNSGSLTVDAPVGTPVFVTATPSTSGGWSVDSRTALTNTAVAIKASAGTFGGWAFYNPNATVAYIQFFNVAAASVTLGTTTPTFVFGIPATSAANVEFTNGIQMGTAMSYAATTTATGSAAPGTALAGFSLFK